MFEKIIMNSIPVLLLSSSYLQAERICVRGGGGGIQVRDTGRPWGVR